jgi:predicted RNase H-like nuclease (RuvC/YqgF family)
MKLEAKKRLQAAGTSEQEIQRLKNRNKVIRDKIYQYKDWNTTGGMDKRIAEMRRQLAENKARIQELESKK